MTFALTDRGWRRGFSLSESLVAVGIVAILAVILLPAISALIERSRAVSCVNNMRQMYVAVMAYRGEHNGFIPPGRFIPVPEEGQPNEMSGVNLKNYLVDEGYIEALPYCPSMRLTAEGMKELPSGKTQKARLSEIGSYSINGFFSRTKIDALPGDRWGNYPYPGNSRMLFLAETYFSGLTWAFDHQKFTLNGAPWRPIQVAPRDHGNKRLNFMFLDGHIAPLAPKAGANGTYDWSESFESRGRNERYVSPSN